LKNISFNKMISVAVSDLNQSRIFNQ